MPRYILTCIYSFASNHTERASVLCFSSPSVDFFFWVSALELRAHCIHLAIRKACRLFSMLVFLSRASEWWNGVGAVCFFSCCFVWFLFQISCVCTAALAPVWFFRSHHTTMFFSPFCARGQWFEQTNDQPIHKFLIYIKFRSKPHRSSLAAQTHTHAS